MRSLWKRWLCAVGLLACACAAPEGDITVSAAASLSDAFKEIGRAFEAQNPDTDVRFNFGASDALVQQLAAGAPVDVLATADQDSMDKAAAKSSSKPTTRKDFVRNTLVAIVPAEREVIPQELSDLERADGRAGMMGSP